MKKFVSIILITFMGIALASCTSSSADKAPEQAGFTHTPAPTAAQALPTSASSLSMDDAQNQTRSDGQGAVTVEIKPINLDHPGDTLDFDVSMNTHSVDLGMDLTKVATLMTDSNQPIPASNWNTPEGGGHHVSGKLSFPAVYDGKPVLQGTSRITLTLTNIDAPTRLFTWQLSK